MSNDLSNPNTLIAKSFGFRVLGLLGIWSLVLGILSPLSTAASHSQSSAISYLKSQTLDDWALVALASGDALSGVNLDFLKTDPGNTATNIEKRILAQVAAGKNPETFGQVNLIQKLREQFNGTEISAAAAAGLLNDDIFGLLAFAAAEKHTDVQAKLADFIKANQNADGGWSFTHSPTVSDSNMTAMGIMALIASGESKTSETINRAFSYLAQTKTASGYRYDAISGYGPDGSSTAWVISALNATGRAAPAEAIAYLESLQRPNGSFAWVASDSSSNLLTTAYAVIALNSRFYPVKPEALQDVMTVRFAVINGAQTIFNGSLSLNVNSTVLNALDSASKQGGFGYATTNTSLGLFVQSIAGVNPEGLKGWMYAVNGTKPATSAANHVLRSSDQVIWYYGLPNDPAPNTGMVNAQVALSANILPKEEVLPPTVSLNASKVSIKIGESVKLTWQTQRGNQVLSSTPNSWAGHDLSGEVTLQPANKTTYTIIVQGPGGTAQNSVTVNVDTTPSIVFGVSTSSVNFGDLKPGQISGEQAVTLRNEGSAKIQITSSLQSADEIYSSGLQINNTPWQNYQAELDGKLAREAKLKLVVPQDYKSAGNKTAVLTFWAQAK